MKPLIPLAFALLGAASVQASETITVTMQQATEKGPGAAVGTVTISESAHGLVFTPNLKGLEPGIHGFHVHAKASCDAVEADGKRTPAGAAGGHWDPNEAGRHGFPWEDDAHLGDLPALYVGADGSASQPVLAPRLEHLEALRDHALMIHAGSDNHADHPQPLGGGGARVACGVIKAPAS
ncbi:superoxide dismutase [Cu-Zn] SodC [Ectopseudomonas khazarica]|uniref:superoxide dismutase [Cu-Zn] SodC n=1 Tax=Ectopseudomonas khazarica TaxID=2502979 RepID=UPI001A166FCA|nr:superoxide dismutase [Cu-Zn] SodC1 [Pseudomonas oleovorans]|tara:strand:- start:8144 stop:8683 length:540 start_codon:yes stop_codon:yes gene_type:complete